ncbi:MAG: PASTA domain-containing protein [Actinomycetota bacterium]|nr:PASTA domain-containing protein [Actinomycetota bacterium]
MSDESDETRRSSPDDAEDPSSEADKPEKPDSPGEKPRPDDLDATQVGGSAVGPDAPPAGGPAADPDATQVDGDVPEVTVGRASVPPPGDDDTLDGVRRGDDDTLDDVRTVPAIRDEPTVVTNKPGSTAIMPPVGDDDWAPSRANPAWSGRAEVRPPQPGRGYPEVDWTASTASTSRDRWWMPIVVGIVALILLGVLGWAIYLILQDSDDETPAPVTSTSATPAETVTTVTTSPTVTPTTTSPSPSPEPTQSTTDPSTSEITVPALRGLALADAQEALRTTGLNYRLIYRQAPDVPPDTVIDSDPVEGQEVPPDTTVTLVIAAQPTTGPTGTTEPTDGN